jgi:hypothetical protein
MDAEHPAAHSKFVNLTAPLCRIKYYVRLCCWRMSPTGAVPDRNNVSEGAMRRWRVSKGERRDRIAPMTVGRCAGGVALRQPQKLGPDSSGSIATS